MLTNRVEKDSTLTVVDVAYMVPVDMNLPVSVEKYSFVALIEKLVINKEDSAVPDRVEKYSVFVLRDEAMITFARNTSRESNDDVKKFMNIVDVYVSFTLIVHPIILETAIVLLIMVDTNKDDTIIF